MCSCLRNYTSSVCQFNPLKDLGCMDFLIHHWTHSHGLFTVLVRRKTVCYKHTLKYTRCNALTHWGRVTQICVSKIISIGSDNSLSPGRRQAIIWTNAWILLIGPLGTNFNETLIEIHTFSFTKIHLKMSSGKWRPFCLGLNVLSERVEMYQANSQSVPNICITRQYISY